MSGSDVQGKSSRSSGGHGTLVGRLCLLKWDAAVQDWQRKEQQSSISWEKGICVS